MIRAEMTCAPEAGEGFVRGDCDTVPGVFMSDAIYLLRAKFVPGAVQCPCVDAADANDNGDWTMGDAIAILRWLFVPGADTLANPQPSLKQSAAIYPGDCGTDATPDALPCTNSFCMTPPGKTTMRAWEIKGDVLLGDARIEDQRVTIPVYLENDVALSGFSYTISYDPTVLRFEGAQTHREFDFFGVNPEEEGQVSVGAVVDLGLQKSLPSGHHEVGELVFEYTTDRIQETTLDFTHVEFVDLQAAPRGARTRGCSIGFGHRRPTVFAMHSSYPNPARDWTTIRYQLPKSIHTTLTVYNLTGQAVKTLVDGVVAPGYHTANWDRTDESGSRVSSGVYFYQLKTDEYSSTRKLVLVE
jgi:hypothetical protein